MKQQDDALYERLDQMKNRDNNGLGNSNEENDSGLDIEPQPNYLNFPIISWLVKYID